MRRYALLLCATAHGGFLSQHGVGMKPCRNWPPWFVKCIDVEAEQAETDAVVGRRASG